MEFFAFIAVFYFSIGNLFKNQKIKNNSVSIFLTLFLAFSLMSIFFHETFSVEKISLAILFCLSGIVFLSAVSEEKYDFFINYLICIIFAAIFSCLIIFSQKFEILDELDIWKAGYEQSFGRPYANFGQPNMAASFILTGLCAGVFLKSRNIISQYTVFLLAIIFSIALAYASSKTSFLAIFLLMGFGFVRKKYNDALLFSTALVIIWVTKYFSVTREIFVENISTGRFDLWRAMADALLVHPYFGYGVLGTRAAHFEVREIYPNPSYILIGSAHNIFFDFLIWFGIPLGIILSLFMLKFLFIFIRKCFDDEAMLYLLIPVTIHSFLEYPLYYANFFFMYIVLISFGLRGERNINIKIPLFIPLLASITIFIAVAADYRNLSVNYSNLRFFKNSFINAESPKKIDYVVLSDTISQYNMFVIDKISNEEEFHIFEKITKQQPALKNFCLIIQYLKNEKLKREFWIEKGMASLNNEDKLFLKKCI